MPPRKKPPGLRDEELAAEKPREVPSPDRRGKFELIPRTDGRGKLHYVYRFADELIEKRRPLLAEARIAFVWKHNVSPDADGHLMLGKATKVPDAHRAIHDYDFVIALNHHIFEREQVSEEHKRAILFHELCHCGIACDDEGVPKRGDDGRPKWRMIKHDLEEFNEVVQAFGKYRKEVEDLVDLASRPLLKAAVSE